MNRYWITFFVILLICVVSFHKINQFYINHALKLDGEKIAQRMENVIVDSIRVIDSLPALTEVKCSQQSIQLLANVVYEADSVRWLGLSDQNGDYCSSLPLDISLNKFQKHKLYGDYSLATLDQSDGHSELLLIKESAESLYVADLNNLSVNTLNDLPCESCVSYRVTIHGDPPISFGERLKDNYAYRFQLRKRIDNLEMTVIFEATNEISEYYSGVSLITTILVSCFFSFVIIYTIERLLNYQRSFRTIIERAIKNDEFKPYYQPIVDCRTNQVVGAEALLKWVEPDGTVRPTKDFISYLEQTGLIIPITSQLVKKIAADIATFGWENCQKSISLNIVPKHLDSDNLFDEIQKAVSNNGIRFENFSLEITERDRIPNLPHAKQAADRFISNGIKLKLDDAGTGYGGFSYIQELQISTLKIDKMFVDTITCEKDVKKPVLDAIISFAKSSSLEIIAEGVESVRQLDYLKSKDVSLIQGFIYSGSLSNEEFKGLLQLKEISATKGI
ncbi:EAL domain-containing protein [Aliikangiella coralliicola]|uniref:EAL domain-containing protein n=1 Tax=Aliikangiella coralliicola TaxID=2592383 RepID=A0A545UJF2_9GAMM|nr:EAL domain-containing protein [Aliikangiella coralliicola]TQV89563.1 EAL domain-containing protein [Aliikangiella coralliicola]